MLSWPAKYLQLEHCLFHQLLFGRPLFVELAPLQQQEQVTDAFDPYSHGGACPHNLCGAFKAVGAQPCGSKFKRHAPNAVMF